MLRLNDCHHVRAWVNLLGISFGLDILLGLRNIAVKKAWSWTLRDDSSREIVVKLNNHMGIHITVINRKHHIATVITAGLDHT